MTQFLARLSNLAASRKRETQEPIYSQEIREAIRAVHEARFQTWPARAGTMVLVRYHIVPEQEAVGAWHELQNSEQLPPDQMQLTSPNVVEDHGEHMRISGVISGRTIAILFSQNVDTLTENALKEGIANFTCIHVQRLMVFKPDGEVFGTTSCEPSEETFGTAPAP